MADEDQTNDTTEQTGNEDTGDSTQNVEVVATTPNVIEEAKAINKKKEELLARDEKLQERKEKLHAEQMLGGHAIAGTQKEQKKELSNQQYAERALAGEFNVKE